MYFIIPRKLIDQRLEIYHINIQIVPSLCAREKSSVDTVLLCCLGLGCSRLHAALLLGLKSVAVLLENNFGSSLLALINSLADSGSGNIDFHDYTLLTEATDHCRGMRTCILSFGGILRIICN